jgi:hypothetical protein
MAGATHCQDPGTRAVGPRAAAKQRARTEGLTRSGKTVLIVAEPAPAGARRRSGHPLHSIATEGGRIHRLCEAREFVRVVMQNLERVRSVVPAWNEMLGAASPGLSNST